MGSGNLNQRSSELSFSTGRRKFLRAGVRALAGFGILVKGRFPLLADSVFQTTHPEILKSWEVGLSVLRPSPSELEKGLRIHHEALVFDAYGFAPRAALDGDRMRLAVENGHAEQEIADLREEMGMTRWATNAREAEEFDEAMRVSGVTCIFQNAGEEGSDPLRLLKRLARFTHATDLAGARCSKLTSADRVVSAKRENRLGLMFTTNGVPLTQRWESRRDEVREIRLFGELGVRMMHLTYNRRNPIGDGAGEPGNGGLSDFGRFVVEEMNRLGIVVDVAHSGWRTSLEAARVSSRPMVASHSSIGGVYTHFRGKPDEVIRAICDTDGYIGVCCIPRFLGGNGDIADFAAHIDYGVRTFGASRIAIGTDVAHLSRHSKEESLKIPKRPAASVNTDRWEHLWPEDKFVPKPHAERSLAWTNWPLFTVAMVQKGMRESDIHAVLGGNVLRVLRANPFTLGS
jgi:membrane dipeptidase